MAYHHDVLLKIAIADAYGMGFEFVPQDIVEQENDLNHYRIHGLYSELEPGQYTDDTQMSLALFEYLCENWCNIEYDSFDEVCNREKIADKFLSTFNRDPRKGYSKGFQKVLEETTSGKELIQKIEANGKTTSNGACMRAIPIGMLIEDEDYILQFAKAQGSITHEGTALVAAQAVALAALWLKQNGSSENLPQFINHWLREDIDWSWNGSRVGGKVDLGINTARAAIHTVMTTTSYSECLRTAVSYGGDTDSVASIACGLAALSSNHKDQTIPEILINKFENKKYGLQYLKTLEKQWEKFIK